MAHRVMCFPRKYEDPNSDPQQACQHWMGIEAHLESQDMGSKDKGSPCTGIVTHATCTHMHKNVKRGNSWKVHYRHKTVIGTEKNVIVCGPLTSLWGGLLWVLAMKEEDARPSLTAQPSSSPLWGSQSLPQWQLLSEVSAEFNLKHQGIKKGQRQSGQVGSVLVKGFMLPSWGGLVLSKQAVAWWSCLTCLI